MLGLLAAFFAFIEFIIGVTLLMHNLKPALKVVTMTAFACFMSFFIYISFFVVVNGITTKVTGYKVIQVDEQGNGTEIGTVTEKPAEIPIDMKYLAIYSEMPTSAEVTLGVLQVVCGVGVYFCMAGSVLASVAAKDRNNSDFNGGSYDKNRGLFIGLFAAIPSTVLYVLTVLLRFLKPSGFSHIYYWFYRWVVMCPVKPIADILTNSAPNLESAPVWSVFAYIIFIALTVVFCYVMYRICYNEDSVIAKILYKSVKKQQQTRRLSGR